MERNVLDYEPDSALFVPDNDPLKFYSAIARFAWQHLANNGVIYLMQLGFMSQGVDE